MWTRLLPGLPLLLALADPAGAWLTGGHAAVTAAAVEALPDELPEWFRAAGATVGGHAIDPDVFKHPDLPELRQAEGPEHFLDLELLRGEALPRDRYSYELLLRRLDVRPELPGFLPYAIVEGTQRLTVAFAEHRRWPEDPAIRAKALLWAGLLAHYAGDLGQPLHTTVHYDGRVGTDGESPRSGIHFAVDALFERAPFDRQAALRDLPVRRLGSEGLLQDVMAELLRSHALVDRVYALEPHLEPETGEAWSEAVVELTRERFRATASFIASLYATAWSDAASLELPPWLER